MRHTTKNKMLLLAATLAFGPLAAHAQGLNVGVGTNVDVNGDNIVDSRDADANINLRGNGNTDRNGRKLDTGIAAGTAIAVPTTPTVVAPHVPTQPTAKTSKKFGTTRMIDARKPAVTGAAATTATEAEGNRLAGSAGATTTITPPVAKPTLRSDSTGLRSDSKLSGDRR